MNNDLWENEASRDPAIELLKKMGYVELKPEESTRQRGNCYNVLLKDVLREQLRRINRFSYGGKERSFSDANIERAITELEAPTAEGLVASSRKIYDALQMGKSFPEFVDEGRQLHFDFRYIDWENLENNVFHVTREFTVQSLDGQNEVRVDIVAFINGIPFAAIECKNPSIPHTKAIEQHLRNQRPEYIPQLYRFTQILVAANKHHLNYATTGSGRKYWMEWKEQDQAFRDSELGRLVENRQTTPQDIALVSLFSHQRVLELLRFFILYDGNVKKICRYHQYFAIKAILNRVDMRDDNENRCGGVVWHTQGSGKSLTMVMLARYLLMKFKNSRVVVVTDRKELDRQITETFAHTRLKPSRAESGRKLANLLKEDHSDIITALINKFSWVEQNAVISPSRDVFILVDESHRTNYGLLATKMRTVFPNGCYIGFTGTPLMKSEKNTMQKFGGLIHKYTILDGVEDGAVVPLVYDGRFVDQTVDRKNIDRWFEDMTQLLSDKQKDDLKRKWSTLERLSSTSERIRIISLDIYNHFVSNIKPTGFKAMLATNFKRDAVRYLECLESLGLKCAVVISPPDMRENPDDDTDTSDVSVRQFWEEMMKKYRNDDEYESDIKARFCRGEIDILIVCSKLLTGFDAPICQVLYLDKALKEHGLLQAIARTNRLYEGKDYGLIIDYRQLFGELDSALDLYSGHALESFESHDLRGLAVDICKVIPELAQAYSRLLDLLAPVSNKEDAEEIEVFLEDDDVRKEFYNRVCEFGRKLATILTSPRAYMAIPRDLCQRYQDFFTFCSKIRRSVKIRYCDAIDNSEYESKMQNLLDTYMSVAGLKRITNPVNIFNQEAFDEELNALGTSRAKADAIVHNINKNIHQHRDENPAFYDSFSQRIEEVLEAFRNRVINEPDYLEQMRDIWADFIAGNSRVQYPDRIKDNVNAQAFYGVISALFDNEMEEKISPDLTAEISEQIAEIIVRNCQVDWRNNRDIHNRISQAIDDLLYKYIDDGLNIDPLLDKIIENVLTVAQCRF